MLLFQIRKKMQMIKATITIAQNASTTNPTIKVYILILNFNKQYKAITDKTNIYLNPLHSYVYP